MRLQLEIVMTAVILLFSVPSLRAEVVDFDGFPALTWPATNSCAPIRPIQTGIMTISGGFLIQGFPGFRYTNSSTFYITKGDCSGATPTFKIVFSVPVSNVSVDLVPGVYEDDYISITDDTGSHQTELIPGSGALIRPMKHVTLACSGCTEITLTTPSLFYSFGIDNIRFDPAPVALQFEIGQSTPENQRRVLISKARSDDQFPSALQDRDGRIKIRIRSSIAQAGISVYLRVVDPPDSSPYIPQPNQVTNDNLGPPGQLSSTLAVTDSGGIAETELIVSAVAGDNYQIEASIDPAIRNPAAPCAAGCEKSGILTAWKRVYVEMNSMAKKGAFITKSVNPGDRTIEVSDVRHFAKGDRVRLLHAPPVEGTGAFYDEEVTVQHVEGKKLLSVGKPEPGILFLYDPDLGMPSGDVIGQAYEWRDLAGNRYRSYLADAVVRVTGNPNVDFYRMSSQERRLIRPLFEEAFTETMFLVDDPELGAGGPLDIKYEGVVPFFDEFALKDGNGNFDTQREWFTRKWMRQGSRAGAARTAVPNHQVVFLAAREAAANSYGATIVADGFNDTWLFLDSIGSAAVAREAIPHELAHQWLVNRVVVSNPSTSAGGHCDAALGTVQTMSSHSGLMCSVTDGEILYRSPEAGDGVVGFHYQTLAGGQVDSEYLRIRQRAEPIPQTEKTGRKPQ